MGVDGRAKQRTWWYGAGAACALAVLVGACGSGSGGDDAATAGTESPPAVTEAADTVQTGDTSESVSSTDSAAEVADTAGTADTASASPSGITYSGDIEPIVTETCASCHTGDGPGTQHVRFDDAGRVSRAAFAMAIVVEDRFMPPWPASDESVEFQHDWSLSDEEIAAIVAWDDAGAPLDVDADTPVVPANGVIGITDPDVVVDARGSYDGELGQDDEYRCFVYDPQVTERRFVSAMEFIPEQTKVVHHAVGFRVSEDDRAVVDNLDGSDGQGGWTCFGFSPGRSAEIVFTWAPGTDPTEFPDGSGLEMEPGDFFVMQTHYHYDVEADADQSQLAIEWTDSDDVDPVTLASYLGAAEIPCGVNESGPLCERDAAVARAFQLYGDAAVIADGLRLICGDPLAEPDGFVDGVARSSCDWPVTNPGEIVSVFGHEHEIGASIRLTLNPDTADEVVLLDIPKWDFDWQFIYEPVDSIVIERSDTIRVECTWDRALRDPELEPAYVLWADGTDDEMCFSTIVTRPAR